MLPYWGSDKIFEEDSMDRKSLLFVFIAVLTALILFTGCPTDGGDDGPGTGGTEGSENIPGGGGGGGGSPSVPSVTDTFPIITSTVSVATLQAYVDKGYNLEFAGAGSNAKAAIPETITITDTEKLGTLDFKKATVTILAGITVKTPDTDLIIDASEATITGSGTLTLKAGDTFITGSGVGTGMVTGVLPVSPGTADDLGKGGNISLGGTVTAEDLSSMGSSDTVYITGTLTVGASDSIPTSGTLVVLGAIEIAGGSPDFSQLTGVDLSAATLTIPSSTATVPTVTLPASVTVKAIDAGKKVTIAGAADALTVGTLTGTVELPAALKEVTITSGEGTIEAPNNGTTITTAAVIGADLTLGSGTLTVGSSGKLDIPENGALTVAEAAEFVVTSGASGTLAGTITIAEGGKLKDNKTGGGSWWHYDDDNDASIGSYVIKAGGEAYSSGSNTPTIGGEGSSAVVVLAEGATLTMMRDKYVLDGNATLQNAFGVTREMTLHITEGSILTYTPSENKLDGAGTFTIVGTLILDGSIVAAGDNPSRIAVLATDQNNPSITIGSKGTNNFYAKDSTAKQEPGAIVPQKGSDYYYKWAADAGGTNAPGWKLQ
jgi:hypothetical protein